MKKILAAIILCVIALVAFLGFEWHEKSTQKELYQDAAVFFEEKDYKKSIQYFEEASEHKNIFTGKLNKELSYYQAEAYANLEEYDKAIEIYDELIREEPRESMNYMLKEYCLYESGDYEEAAKVYEMGYEKTGEEEFLSLLANLYVSTEEYDKALSIITDENKVKEASIQQELDFLEIVISEKQQNYGEAYEKAARYCEAYPEDEKGQKEKDFLESRK